MFVHQVRVLYGDTDTAQIVYHANYLRYFEAARTELLRAGGLTYAGIELRGFVWPIVEQSTRHRKPARYDDLLFIETTVSALGRASVTFDYRVRSEAGDTLCEGRTRLGCTRQLDGRIVAIPDDVRDVLVGHAASPGNALPRRLARPLG